MRMLLVALSFFSAGAFAQVSTYKVDPSHTALVFRVNHMGFSMVYGMFSGVDGKFVIDEKSPDKSTFELTAKVENLTTLDKKRDDHLKGPDFFNMKQYPTITMKSKKVKKSGEAYDITADLTMHGVTKPITFSFKQMKVGKDPWGNTRFGGETVLNLRRADYNMTYMNKPGEVGDDVEIMVSVEGVKQ